MRVKQPVTEVPSSRILLGQVAIRRVPPSLLLHRGMKLDESSCRPVDSVRLSCESSRVSLRRPSARKTNLLRGREG